MKEFIYYNKQGLEFPLNEAIYVTSKLEDLDDNEFLISNINHKNVQSTANEIDFYIKSSQDSISKKISNIHKLYEIALLRFDLAQDIIYTQTVENKLLIIGAKNEAKEFIKSLNKDEFNLFHIDEKILKSINGHIGNLSILIDDEGEDIVLNVDQIVWFDMKQEGLKQSGCFDPKTTSNEDIIKKIRENIGDYGYKKFITYDEKICQYHERREEICAKCEEVCPTVAITKIDSKKNLVFSQIDCHGCGGCVSICPSGAVDYASINKDTIFELACQFKDFIPLIIPQKMELEGLDISLKEGVLPFKIDGEKFLHESSFLTILQESGSQVVFYTDFLSKGSKDSIEILNKIYTKKYGKKAILVAMNEDELKDALNEATLIENSKFTYNQDGIKKRENFSIRLAYLVANDDLGTIKTGDHIHYAKVNIAENNCTLCLSCVGACNVGALSANSDDFTLRLNPSLCTACGYCELTCPEKNCLSIEQDVILLNPSWFKQNIVAKDEMFRCLECNKEFATKKSIEKISDLMKPIFKGDETKIRTLYCCEKCKPIVMFSNKAMINQIV